MRAVAFAVLMLSAALCPAAQGTAPKEPDVSRVQFSWGVRIPLRDGIHLNATAYLPREQQEPAPCVFTLTPYIADTYHERGVYFAAHGYPFLIVDVRGRGNSEGVFRPFIQEAQDGYDVVEWLARQPYCNGKVTMWGGSYAGYDQWATAKEFPPHLATVVPVAAPYLGVDFPFRSNIFWPYLMKWITYTSGNTAQTKIFADGTTFWNAIYRRWMESGAPYADLDRVVSNPSPLFQEWIAHPHPDSYWDRFNPSAAEYAKLAIPILTITGSYDADQPGALTHYREHMRNATEEGRARHYLIIGPWDHDSTRTPQPQYGGVSFGSASLLDLPKLHLQWYAWTMQNGPKPGFLQKAVAYYVMGADRWRYADSLQAVTARSQAFFLQSTGLESTGRPSSGVVGEPRRAGALGARALRTDAPERYVYDPRDLRGIEAEAVVDPSRIGARLTQPAPETHLIYDTARFAANTEVSGCFKLSAWIAIDQPDTDFAVSVYEIDDAGGSVLLSSDAMRARYRASAREPRLIHTKQPLRYDFDRFTFVSREIRKGHRLRVSIGPLHSMHSEKNYNSGGVVAEESMKDARPVAVTLYHDRTHPSALYVPLGRMQ